MSWRKMARKRLVDSANESKLFWEKVKSRFPSDMAGDLDSFNLLDIQTIDDDCLDMIFLRTSENSEIEQLEHCRITVEKRLFQKPKISVHFTSGPFKEEFFGGD